MSGKAECPPWALSGPVAVQCLPGAAWFCLRFPPIGGTSGLRYPGLRYPGNLAFRWRNYYWTAFSPCFRPPENCPTQTVWRHWRTVTNETPLASLSPPDQLAQSKFQIIHSIWGVIVNVVSPSSGPIGSIIMVPMCNDYWDRHWRHLPRRHRRQWSIHLFHWASLLTSSWPIAPLTKLYDRYSELHHHRHHWQ